MDLYDYELERIKKRYDYWKKVGYEITYTHLPDRLKVTFVNKSEGIPCYLAQLVMMQLIAEDFESIENGE